MTEKFTLNFAGRSLIIILMFLWMSRGVASFAQTPTDRNIIPPTPNVASIAKFGDVPIGLHTGQLEYNIQLHSIQESYFNVPISLSYNYAGLQVENYPGWTGAGWTLNCTAVISRQQRSLPDERQNGYNGSAKRGKEVMAFIESGADVNNPDFKTFLEGARDRRFDTEPDLFVFSIPGGASGKFFFDASQCDTEIKEAIVIPHQNLKIKGYFNYTGRYNTVRGIIEKFVITNEQGVKYTFDVIEKAAGIEPDDSGAEDEDFGNSWYLSSISDPYNHTVRYYYKYRTLDNPPTVREEIMVPYEMTPNPRFHSTSTKEAILEKIEYRNGVVEFIESETTREDWKSMDWTYSKRSVSNIEDLPRALAKIVVKAKNEVVKEFEFQYGYFGGAARLKLESLREKSGGLTKPPYVFTYKNGTFPNIGNELVLFSQDHWGFYTGGYHNTLLPPYYNMVTDAAGNQTPIKLPGNLRVPSPNFSSAGILIGIQYPTGGETTIEYEPNSYFGSFQGPSDFNICSGKLELKAQSHAKLNKFTDPPGKRYDEQIIPIRIDKGVCAKVLFSLSLSGCLESMAFAILETSTGQEIGNYRVAQGPGGKESSSRGVKLGELFTLSAGDYVLKTIVEEGSTSCPQNPGTTKASIELYISAGSGSSGPQVENRIAGGMRVKSVKDCPSGPCSGCITKRYEYNDITMPAKSSGLLIHDPVYVYGQFYIINVGSNMPEMKVVRGEVVAANSLIPLATTQGVPVAYKYVTVTEELDGKKGKTVYEFTSADQFPDSGSGTFPFPPTVSNSWQRGKQVYQTDFANSADQIVPLQKRFSSYQAQSTFNKKVGLKVGQKVVPLDFPVQTQVIQEFHFLPYAIRSGWMKLSGEETTTYDLNNTISAIDTTLYFYENSSHMNVTKVITSSSTEDKLTSVMKYPDDVASIENLSNEEKAGIENCPDKTAVIEKKEFKNSNLLAVHRNLYQGANHVKYQYAKASGALLDIENMTYDGHGNISQITTIKGDKESYVYGYNNMYQIAEVSNATPSDIFHTSFEEDGVSSQAKTGEKVKTGGSYTFPPSFAPADASNLLMSYWYWSNNKWNFSNEIPYAAVINSSGSKLDEIRVYPRGSKMTTFTYTLGKGISSQTDANHLTQYYEYDALGQLLAIYDDKKNVVKAFEYKYKGE
jgi:hypothetical protein